MDMFEKRINYREKSGSGVLSTGEVHPGGLLAESSLVLMFHGYNNDIKDATGAYERFCELLSKNYRLNANLVGVYWPGDNWEGPLYYMQAIGQAKKVAPVLAADLYKAAKNSGRLKIDIVAHSLGCRLVLETIKVLLILIKDKGRPGLLEIRKVVFMAAAVPTKYLEEVESLRNELQSFNGSLSLYSKHDTVLHYAFPAGQTAAGEGFLPVALGRKKWDNGELVYPPLKQEQNLKAGHSDYWGKDKKNIIQREFAAKRVREFLSLGTPLPREISPRQFETRNIPVRDITEGRTVSLRTVI